MAKESWEKKARLERCERTEKGQNKKQPGWISKVWYSHTMEYYSAIKNEVLIHTASWMNSENIMLYERSQTQKSNIV